MLMPIGNARRQDRVVKVVSFMDADDRTECKVEKFLRLANKRVFFALLAPAVSDD
jgi:hypothetical protein